MASVGEEAERSAPRSGREAEREPPCHVRAGAPRRLDRARDRTRSRQPADPPRRSLRRQFAATAPGGTLTEPCRARHDQARTVGPPPVAAHASGRAAVRDRSPRIPAARPSSGISARPADRSRTNCGRRAAARPRASEHPARAGSRTQAPRARAPAPPTARPLADRRRRRRQEGTRGPRRRGEVERRRHRCPHGDDPRPGNLAAPASFSQALRPEGVR
jgi:hypothetical protein